mgnify:FL=1
MTSTSKPPAPNRVRYRWSPRDALAELRRSRGLIRHLIGREIRTKYAGSLLGWFWALVNPLASLIVYTLVFGVFLRTDPPIAPDGFESFAHFLFSGLVVWNLFSASSLGAMEAFRESMVLRKRVYFPPECPIIARTAVALLESAVEVLVLFGAFLLAGHVSWTFLFMFLLMPLTALFGVGVGMGLSVLNARFRDVSYLYSVVLRFLFFLTPIIYPMSLLEGREAIGSITYDQLIKLNPMTWYVGVAREATYMLEVPSLRSMAVVLVSSIVVLLGGWWIFSTRAPDVSEGQ